MDREHLRQLRRARWPRVIKAIVIAAIVVLLIVFVLRNSDPVEVDFVFLTRSPRFIWVLVVTALLGAVAGYLLGRPSRGTRLHRRDPEENRR